MPRFFPALAAAVALAAICVGGQPPPKPPVAAIDKPNDVCFGTTIHFVESPKDAAAQAKKDEKLVLILHVSGYFEDPRFT